MSGHTVCARKGEINEWINPTGKIGRQSRGERAKDERKGARERKRDVERSRKGKKENTKV